MMIFQHTTSLAPSLRKEVREQQYVIKKREIPRLTAGQEALTERRINNMNGYKKSLMSLRGGIQKTRHLGCIFVASVLVAAALTLLGASGAWAATVVPNEGTIGTTFTISGSNFGAKRGTVFIGSIPAQVLAWSDTEIDCLIRVPMSPGDYDLVLNPQGKGARMILPTFAIRPPSITPGIRPNFVSPGQEITIEGAFFGSGGLHKVEIESLQGKKRPCHIVDWSMDSITFELPDGIPGIFNIEVTNGVGTDIEPWWGTFATRPEGPPTMPGGYIYEGGKSYDNATAVVYQNKLWFFWPDNDKNIRYRIWDGATWSSTTYYLKDTNGSLHQSVAQVNPVVVDNYLYMFETRLDGDIHVTKYDPLAVDPDNPTEIKPVWISMHHLPIAVYDVHGKYAAVYNYVKKYVEIYITTDNHTIEWGYYNPSNNHWYDQGALQLPNDANATDPNIKNITPHLSAVFNGNELDNDYVTYLSYGNTYIDVTGSLWNYGYVLELKDGVVLHSTNCSSWHSFDQNSGPSLVDLGEKYLAVIYNSGPNQSRYQKYDKDRHSGYPYGYNGWPYDVAVPWTSTEDCNRAPNGIVFSQKVSDSSSPTGYHMESRFYAIVEDNPKFLKANWQLVECEYLGYWKPTGPPNYVDFQGGDLSNNDEVNQRLSDTFPSWTVIGLLDMPPFVRNGHEKCTDYGSCITDAEISFQLATTEGFSGEYSAGAYVESGLKSRVTYDISTGYTGGFENSKTFTYSTAGSVEENLEGRILAFYIVPRFNVYTLEWYDFSGAPTGIYTEALETLAPAVRKEVFDPEIGPEVAYYQGNAGFDPPYLNVAKTPTEINDSNKFPMHASENDQDRLDTYFRNPTVSPFNFQSIVDPALSQSGWAVNSPGSFEWAIDQEHSIDNGFYSDIKIGSEIAHRIGFGVEGSFKILVNTKTQKDVEAITTLKSQEPIDDSDPSRVTSFNVEGYWLKPSASGYWVPNNRKGMGDAPWFITYRVTDYHP